MITNPNGLKVGDRVRHDVKRLDGVVIEVFTERGHKGALVDFAMVQFGGGDKPLKHPWATLTKL